MDIRFRCDRHDHRSGRWAARHGNRQRWLGRLAAVAVVLSVAVRGAHADARDDDAVASQLFDEGRVLAHDERWPEACAKFEDSQRRAPAPGTSLNLARCYEKTGKLDHAWQLYRKAVDLAERAGNFVRRDFAQARAEALEPRLAKVVISWPGNPSVGLVVTWDGRPLERTAQRTTLHAEAGSHRLIASASGNEVFIKHLTLLSGETRTIEIPDLLASRPGSDQSAPDSIGVTDRVPVLASAANRPRVTRDLIMLGLGATGLVATTVGLVFGARASQEYDRAKALCTAGLLCSALDGDRRRALVHEARSDAMVSTVLVGAGGAAAIASAILFVIRPGSHTGDPVRIVPTARARGAGLALSGPF